MIERERMRVQGLAREDRRTGRGECARHIDPIADQRVPRVRKMDPDLVGATGFEPAFDQRGRIQPFERAIMRDRVLASAVLFDKERLERDLSSVNISSIHNDIAALKGLD